MIFDVSEAEDKLGYVFRDKMLLRKAFTHASYINENPGSESNEILEFFGDSILGFVVKEHLFKRFPEKHEGELTEICQHILSTEPLSAAVLRKRLNDCLLLGMGELKNKDNKSICEDLFEASVAAIYLDGGLAPAKKFILETLAPEIESSLDPANRKKPLRTVRRVVKPKAEKPAEKPKEGKAEKPKAEVLAPAAPMPKATRAKKAEQTLEKPVRKTAKKALPKPAPVQPEKDAKSRLSEAMQKAGRTPDYIQEKKEGPEHEPKFTVRLEIDGEKISRGTGGSKKAAEMQAAEKALKKLKI